MRAAFRVIVHIADRRIGQRIARGYKRWQRETINEQCLRVASLVPMAHEQRTILGRCAGIAIALVCRRVARAVIRADAWI